MYVLKRWIKEILSLFVFLRFDSIMDLYFYLYENNITGGVYASVFSYICEKRNCFIGYFVKFKNQPYFPFGLDGVYISSGTKIGENCVIFHQVTIGAVRTRGSKNIGNPTIGDNCYIGAGAKIIGKIKIGNNVRIGANAVVYQDIPDNTIVVSEKTRIISAAEPLDNKYYILDNDGIIKYWKDGRFHESQEYDI
ncbi:MAG TPA: serine acetyltransferase [Erysipelotrichaceae bacterium]|nr:serine acetyltransferase [Erysipelotrichaceae bacterium]